MKAIHGIRTFFLCTKGTLLTIPANVIVGGHRGDCNLNWKPVDPTVTVLDHDLVNDILFNMTAPSYQANLAVLQAAHNLILNGADMQLITVPQTAGVGNESSGGVFNFNGDNFPGFEYEFTLTPKERSIKIITEFSTPENEAQALIVGSLTNVPKNLSTYGNGSYALDNAKRIPPIFVSIFSNASALLSREELLDYKITIKTLDSGKSAYKRADVHYYSVLAEITTSNAVVSALNSIMNTPRYADLAITQRYDASNNDVFNFANYALQRKEEVEIADKKRALKLVFKGNTSVQNVTFGNIVGTIPHLMSFAA